MTHLEVESKTGRMEPLTLNRDEPGRLRRWLTHRYFPAVAVLCGMVLSLPALWAGWEGDDHIHRLVLHDPARAQALRLHNTGSPTGLFTFLSGDPARTHDLMDVGIVPWWTYPGIKANFLRPICWLTHWLDYRLWPDQPLWMHAQSLFWYGAVILVASVYYRRIMGSRPVAGLAMLLFAVDDAHATTLGWISNRNALLAVLFGVLALVAYDQWRRRHWRLGAMVSPLLLLSSLLSAEGGIATGAYLFAYALFIDRKSAVHRRLLALLPCGVVVLVWRLVWMKLGFGSSGMGLYADPGGEPLRFAMSFLHHAPLILLGQLAFPPPDLSIFLTSTWVIGLWLVAIVFLAFVMWVVLPVLRKDSVLRFWTLGSLLTLIPCSATLPTDRNLLFLGFGVMGGIACLLVRIVPRKNRPASIGPTHRRDGVLGVFFVVMHAVVAPILLSLRAAIPLGPGFITNQLLIKVPMGREVVHQSIVVTNAPSAFHVSYLPILRASHGEPVPAHIRLLSPSLSAVTLKRLDLRTILITPETGYIKQLADQLYRGAQVPMSLGETVQLTGMTARVIALTDDGRPGEVVFRFDVPLEDSSLRWLQWKGGQFVPFVPPRVGGVVHLPAPMLLLPQWKMQRPSASPDT